MQHATVIDQEGDWDGLEQILSSFTIDEIAPNTSNKKESASDKDPIITRLLSAEFEPPAHAPVAPTKIAKAKKTKGREVKL